MEGRAVSTHTNIFRSFKLKLQSAAFKGKIRKTSKRGGKKL